MSDGNDNFILEFEKPVKDLENQIKELREVSNKPGIDLSSEIEVLKGKVDGMLKEIYSNLSEWERVQLSRHPQRPHASDYIDGLVDEFKEISGDRHFADDPSVIAGFGRFEGKPVAVIGIEKGRKTKDKIHRNFGMPRPEGYRKAGRLMEMAGRLGIPVLTFVDTPGAYPGIGAEERGQASAIAENLQKMFEVKSPMVAVVIGEGGSGGALGIAVCDRVFMQEYSVYSVISPESCASILWADTRKAQQAAESLKLSPKTAKKWGVIDGIIPEPAGGAHRNPEVAMSQVRKAVKKAFKELEQVDSGKLLEQRYEKFREMGRSTISED